MIPKEQAIRDGLVALPIAYYARLIQLYGAHEITIIEFAIGVGLLPISAYIGFQEGKKFQREPV